jgi:hypothetical protein
MSTTESSTSETPIWNAPVAIPKPHSRTREAETTCCAGVTCTKSLACIEIPLWIYDSRDGLGLFSQDPSGFGGGDYNLYRYTANSPLTHTDPSGLIAKQALSVVTNVAAYFTPIAAPAIHAIADGIRAGINDYSRTGSIGSAFSSGASMFASSYSYSGSGTSTNYAMPGSSAAANAGLNYSFSTAPAANLSSNFASSNTSYAASFLSAPPPVPVTGDWKQVSRGDLYAHMDLFPRLPGETVRSYLNNFQLSMSQSDQVRVIAASELQRTVDSGKMTRDEAFIRSQVLENAMKGKIEFTDDDHAYRNPKFWTDKSGPYTVRPGILPENAISDIFVSGCGTGCRKAADLSILQANIDYFRGTTNYTNAEGNRVPATADWRESKLEIFNNFIGGQKWPGQYMHPFYVDKYATPQQLARGGFNDSDFRPGDNVQFSNPDYVPGTNNFGAGGEGSNTFYVGEGMFIGFDGKIYENRSQVGEWGRRPFPAAWIGAIKVPGSR